VRENNNLITDFKTTNDATVAKWAKWSLLDLNYKMQALQQIRGAAVTGYMKGQINYAWAVQCKNPPYDFNLVEYTQASIDADMKDLYFGRLLPFLARWQKYREVEQTQTIEI
jgi:hypothetical protein